MPYIHRISREVLDPILDKFPFPLSPGEMNYLITKICKRYVEYNGLCYRTLNDIHGILNNADKEFYRRYTAPYEDEKIKQNGDI